MMYFRFGKKTHRFTDDLGLGQVWSTTTTKKIEDAATGGHVGTKGRIVFISTRSDLVIKCIVELLKREFEASLTKPKHVRTQVSVKISNDLHWRS